MRYFPWLSWGLVCALALVVPASAETVCLKTYLIDHTTIVDAKTIDFRMRDGTVYRNTLTSPCRGLLFDGFIYTVHTNEICDNLQSIRVIRSGQTCLLGAFTKLPPPAGAAP